MRISCLGTGGLRRRTLSSLGLSLLSLAALVVGGPARAQYELHPLDVPGAVFATPFSINDNGVITGYYYDASYIAHGLIWQNGVATTLDYPGSLNTLLGASNTKGQIVGNYDDGKVSHAFIYDSATQTWTTLPDIPNRTFNVGNGINEAGIAVGVGLDDTFFNGVAWMWDGTSYTYINYPGAVNTGPNSINDHNQIVGNFDESNGGYHGYVQDGSQFTPFDVPNTDDTQIYGINNQGDIAGRYFLNGKRHGFILHDGLYTTVDFPSEGLGTWILDLNGRRDLVGFYVDGDGNSHGFRAVAVPEPGSLILLAGLFCGGVLLRGRRRL